MNFYQLVFPAYFFRKKARLWGTPLQCLPFLLRVDLRFKSLDYIYNATNLLSCKEIIVFTFILMT